MSSQNPFKWRHFEAEIILLCIRWYLRYALSYRDLEEMMAERGLLVDHTTIFRLSCKPMHLNWRSAADHISKRVTTPGKWMRRTSKLRKSGRTSTEPSIQAGTRLPFLLSPTRDAEAAKRFFCKALLSTTGSAPQDGLAQKRLKMKDPSAERATQSIAPADVEIRKTIPRVINVDKNAAYPKAIAELKAAGVLPQHVELRQVKYLNNLIEQDHRFIKRLTKPGMGFFSFETAWRTLQGFEMMNMLRKGQIQGVDKGDVRGQVTLIARLFGVAG